MQPKKICILSVSVFAIFVGLIVVSLTPTFLKMVIEKYLILTPNSHIYNLWNHFPDLVPMDFYLFNWTNPEEIYNKSVKPKFQELGPYRFMVDLQKVNVVWNKNGTVTFKQMKYYFYDREGTNGTLQDKVTFPNPVALGAAHVARTWNYLTRKGLSVTLRSVAPTIHVTRTVGEVLFDGYPETLSKMAKTFPFFAGTDVPLYDKFGWFYMRNGSADFEGVYNTGTGIGSVFGKLYSWNYWKESPYFKDNCGKIDGTTGDKFEELESKYIKVFSPEMCRPVSLTYAENRQVDGITGRKYIMDDYVLDNGTKYPQNKCFCNGDCLPSGIFNVSSCRYGSPAFGSLPHFYKADPYYNQLIDGCNPKKKKHEFSVIVEPNTGLPLEINVRIQLNMMLHSIPDIGMYENVPKVFLPFIWFEQHVKLPLKESSRLRQLNYAKSAFRTLGALLIIAGLIPLFYIFIVRKKKIIRGREEVPLKLENKTDFAEERQEISKNKLIN